MFFISVYFSEDGNERQREAVRRKIAIYLKKAEELYHEHLTNESDPSYSNRWDVSSHTYGHVSRGRFRS